MVDAANHHAKGSQEPQESRFHRGTNQSGMRDYNERLVLSLVRRYGSLSKSDIARMTKLSAQTVSVIMRELEDAKLLLRLEPIRGKIGQPSVPMALDPEGAYFLGLKIGRRSAELVLIDFLGQVRGMLRDSYKYPTPQKTVEFASNAIAKLRGTLDAAQNARISGLGIAIPYELWNWADAAGAPLEVMEEWRNRDIRADLQPFVDFPVYLENDATAACGAELVFGKTHGLRDFIYFYIGAFAGGGVVLNGGLYTGQSGNAGAVGSMPVPGEKGEPMQQLIDVASLATLEKSITDKGRNANHLWTAPEDWGDLGPELDQWIAKAGKALAYAIVSASSILDFEAAVIEGWMPAKMRERLVSSVRMAMDEIDVEGLNVPSIVEGTVGIHARALGGASLPLSERFLIGPGPLLKGN